MDESAHTGEVTGIECRGCGDGSRRVCWGVVVWEQRKSPELGARGFPPPLEKDGVVGLVEDGDRVCVKEDAAAMVAEFADTNEVVFEGGHNVAFLDREIGEEVGGSGG